MEVKESRVVTLDRLVGRTIAAVAPDEPYTVGHPWVALKFADGDYAVLSCRRGEIATWELPDLDWLAREGIISREHAQAEKARRMADFEQRERQELKRLVAKYGNPLQ